MLKKKVEIEELELHVSMDIEKRSRNWPILDSDLGTKSEY